MRSEPTRNCHYCLCRVCGSLRCPYTPRHHFDAYRFRGLYRCFKCEILEKLHVLECDYFEFRKPQVYKVIRKKKKTNEIIERLERIEQMLMDTERL